MTLAGIEPATFHVDEIKGKYIYLYI